MKPNHRAIEVDPTEDASLRVSVATLNRVISCSKDENVMLALERKSHCIK